MVSATLQEPLSRPLTGEAHRLLCEGGAALGLRLSPSSREALLRYLALLARWNRVFSLTAITAPREAIGRHLLDSLAVVPYLDGQRVLDVGTGAGLPGIVLALACAERTVTLLDSNTKKIQFVRHAIAELSVTNASVEHVRVENYYPAEGFDVLITRAVGPLGALWEQCAHLLGPTVKLLAMKGRYPRDELESLPAEVGVCRVIRLHVPALEAERHLVELRRRPLRGGGGR